MASVQLTINLEDIVDAIYNDWSISYQNAIEMIKLLRDRYDSIEFDQMLADYGIAIAEDITYELEESE